jgi:CyaY protein
VETPTEKDYQARAFPELRALVDALDAFPDEVFAELAGDVLTIEFEDKTRYVVNSHLAARQIWLAAERSAWHFDHIVAEGRWVDRKSKGELWSTLAAVLGRKLGRPVTLEPPAQTPSLH